MAEYFKACSIDGCNGNAHWRAQGRLGMCVAHYMRQRRNGGDPRAGRTPPGSRKEFAYIAAVSATDECIIWPFPPNKATGYGAAKINGINMTAHRAVLCMSTGENPPRHIEAAHMPEVCHNRLCVNPRHLRWATKVENEADKKLDGTHLEGAASPRSAFTEDQVRSIRSNQRSLADLAQEFGVSKQAIWCVRANRTYRNVT